MQKLDPRRHARPGFGLVAAPISPSATSQARADKGGKLSKRGRADARDTRRLAAWRDTGDVLKMKAMARVWDETRPVLAFSLNLGRDIEAKAMVKPTKAKSFLHERLTKAILRHLMVPAEFAFVVEFTEADRLHIHGIIFIDSSLSRQAMQALKDAGGTWGAAHSERQADLRPLWSGDGWANYLDKTVSKTKRILGIKSVLSSTRELQRAAKGYWGSLRTREKKVRRCDV
ncbi:hypothetical protein NGM99_01065 [Mesorhizobium sp. RP14(2022)]|uniref:Inovirus Gp2 family protein n=1 Tax=Mesorhizobium liriopis TaxID=2953882 RepID=A0ABT1C0M4_9HYPH|nr:hypothetical protein [Mesorhizobium liriopis]MCO6048379.1 hypothetical protein [Mesorhizobium liriopis]